MSNHKHIYFLVPYPLHQAPSQRFRFEQYFDSLEKNGYKYQVQSFIDEQTWFILYKPGKIFSKAWGICKGFLRRWLVLPRLISADFVFIHREAAPIGPPIFEWIISNLLRKKIIFDFDDAIWLPNTSDHNKIAAAFKYHSKTSSICSWSYKISCGNQYLANFARKYNSNVVVNPTTIDMDRLHTGTIDYTSKMPVIGWTGTHSTIPYLNHLVPVLKKLREQFPFKCIVISNKKPEFDFEGLEFIPWNKETEIEDLKKINIGIMPLRQDQWAEGKCGFKGLQYMSLGIATIMSPVGVNKEIIQEGQNGFLADGDEAWSEKLSLLIQDSVLREKLGRRGQETIRQKYSVTSNASNFIHLFS